MIAIKYNQMQENDQLTDEVTEWLTSWLTDSLQWKRWKICGVALSEENEAEKMLMLIANALRIG